MNIINHQKMPAHIKCLGMTEEVDRPEANDPTLQQLCLEGKIEFDRGSNFSWIDTDFQQHFGRVEYGEKRPVFEIVEKPGFKLSVLDFGSYEWTTIRV